MNMGMNFLFANSPSDISSQLLKLKSSDSEGYVKLETERSGEERRGAERRKQCCNS
jgi:hypothetical protein